MNQVSVSQNAKVMNFLTKRLKLRNPFTITKLPRLCELYLKISTAPYRTAWERRVSRRVDEFRFRSLMRAHDIEKGEMSVVIDGQLRKAAFDSRNTQFHSVYSPDYRNGYEPETMGLLDLLLKDQDVFYDVGSNWGHYSVFVASRPRFKGHVHAFEAHPKTFFDLQATICALQIERVVECHNFGVSDSDSTASISFPDGLHSGLATINETGHGVPIALKTLDALGLEPPDVIKLDVEGYEAAALRGATRIFRQHSPMLVFENWCNFKHPQKTLEPFQLLESLGYFFFQPVFVRSTAGLRYVLAAGKNADLDSEVELALEPIATSKRFLFAEYLNIFACPESRIDQLEAVFGAT